MSDPTDQLQKTLKERGFSLTAVRKTTFEALQDSEPLTMQELVSRCQDFDRASIYRTVMLFEQLGIVQRLQIGWKYKLELTDSFIHHHHHLTCIHCGVVTPLPEDATLEKRLQVLSTLQGFVPHDHQLEIRGLCRNCRPSSTIA
jgi:Fur family ferric uptake transcriptional regulator